MMMQRPSAGEHAASPVDLGMIRLRMDDLLVVRLSDTSSG